MRRTRLPHSFLVLILLFCTASWASAYVPTTPQLTRKMFSKLGRIRCVALTKQEHFYPDPAPETAAEPRVLSGVLTVQTPDASHDLLVDDGRLLETYATSKVWFRLSDGRRVEAARGVSELYLLPLQIRKRAMFEEALLKHGVDVNRTSLDRHNGRIAWVMGEKGRAGNRAMAPQFWLEKESFLPMRWVLPTRGGATVEIWYHDWFKEGNASWPGRIEFYRDGFLYRDIRITKARSQSPLPRKRFLIETYTPYAPTSAQSEPAPQPTEGEMRLKEIESILSRDVLAF